MTIMRVRHAFRNWHLVRQLRHAERAEKKEMIDALHSWLVTEMLELMLSGFWII